ncbi:hypothetical protein [Halorubrum sp. DTA98]|uniref:hypothetical protein n=1 Tax=Halorubrum sp. DTA98 TaxID=3402163 RepID=UPI003AAE17AA
MNPTSTHPDRAKSTLFCPECRFESPAAAEWLAVTTATERRLVCPDCGAVVDSRSRRASAVPHPAD